MVGGAPIFMPGPMYAPPQGYAPQGYVQSVPPRPPAVPAAAPVYRGSMGKEPVRSTVTARPAPLKIPTPEELGVSAARPPPPLTIPTPEELGVRAESVCSAQALTGHERAKRC